MDNTTNSLLNFFLDRSRSIGIKTALTISVLGLLLSIDIGLNLSYNLSLNNKINQLEHIQNLKKSYQTDTLKLNEIVRIENEILNKKHYSDFFNFDVLKSTQTSEIQNKIPNPTNTSETKSTKIKPIIISTFWMAFSSTYSLMLSWPILILLPLFPSQTKQKNFFIGWLAINILWIGLIILITVIAFQIPIISGNPTYNYWLNFGIHSMFLILIYFVSKKNK